MKSLKIPHKKTVWINKFSEDAGYKVNIQRPVVCFFFSNFIYLTGRKKARAGERQKEGEADPREAGSPTRGSIPELWDHDLSWRQMLHLWSHPDDPTSCISVYRWRTFANRNLKSNAIYNCINNNLGMKVTKNEKDIVHSTHGRKEMQHMCIRGSTMHGSKIWKATQTNGSIRHAP